MTLPSRHRIGNSNPGGLRPSMLSLGHVGSPNEAERHLSPKHTNERDSGAKIIKPSICFFPKQTSAKASVKGNAIIFRRHFFCVSRPVFVPEKSKQMNLALEQGQTSHILRLIFRTGVPVNAKHLYSIYTMLDQRRRRWADVVQILCKCFVFAGMYRQSLVACIFAFALVCFALLGVLLLNNPFPLYSR